VVNQLYPGSIGIYPLITIYPKSLPRQKVQSKNLIIIRSPGFGSNKLDYNDVHNDINLT